MLCVTELLPPSKAQLPSDKLALQWYYLMYHRADHAEYVKSGKTLPAETIETLTAYIQLIFAQHKNDGTLERAEVDRICDSAKWTLRMIFATSARHVAQITCAPSHASADDMSVIDRIVVATTIDVETPMVDWNATDKTDTTTNQTVETAMVDMTSGHDATATTAVQCQQKIMVEKRRVSTQ